MKKLLIALFLTVSLTFSGVAIAGEIFDSYNAIVTEKVQRDDIISFKSALVRTTKAINAELAKMQAIKDSGSFDTIPANVKTFFLQWETAIKGLQTTLDGNATVQEFVTGGEAP